MKMLNTQLIERFCILVIALESMAFGIAFTIHSDLGVTAISAPPLVLSYYFSPTIGQFNIMLHTLFVILQICILRSKFQKKQLFQVVIGIIFGVLIDINNYIILNGINPKTYLIRVVFVAIGSFFLGFGISIQSYIKTINSAGEGFLYTVVDTFKLPFGRTKVCLDCTLCAIAIILSLVLLDKLKGIREGTVISSFLIGFFSGLIRPKIGSYIINFLWNFPEKKGEEKFNDNLFIDIEYNNKNSKEVSLITT